MLSVHNLSKHFGTLLALQDLSFGLPAGEILGVVGRSGSGKSVLLQLLAGILPLDQGEIHWQGQRLPLHFRAAELGITTISQKPLLIEYADVPTNIFLGRERSQGMLHTLHQAAMVTEARRLMTQLGNSEIDLQTPANNLSSEQRQLLSIARVMAAPGNLVLADNPAVLLSTPYQQKLLDVLRAWRAAGSAVLFVTNNLDHLFAVTDQILVLYNNASAGIFRTAEATREQVVRAIAGIGSTRELSPTVWALDSYYQARQQAESLHQQQALMQRSLAAQDDLNRHLLEQLAEQVQALNRANQALQEAQRRLLTEREQERKRLARELHDQVIQDLLGLNYRLEDLGESQPTAQLTAQLEDLRVDIGQLVADLRNICSDLRPPTIDSLGLGAALQSYTRDWQKHTTIRVQLQLAPDLARLPEEIELAFFRIAQEALSNVRKHAAASRVMLTLSQLPAKTPGGPASVQFTIDDNGKGLAPNFALGQGIQNGHFGLHGIYERVTLLGGTLRLSNGDSGGLQLQVEVPIGS